MRRVILESPFSGRTGIERAQNAAYARLCLLDCLRRGEAPFASHMLYTQALDDDDTEQRALGMKAGFTWVEQAEASVVYTDRGISLGMQEGIMRAQQLGKPVEFRSILDVPA